LLISTLLDEEQQIGRSQQIDDEAQIPNTQRIDDEQKVKMKNIKFMETI
jgi:hypothetical protein